MVYGGVMIVVWSSDMEVNLVRRTLTGRSGGECGMGGWGVG